MLRDSKGMPRIQEIADAASIAKYGGRRMLLAPPLDYDALMRQVPPGRLTTVGLLRQQLAERYGADFTDPLRRESLFPSRHGQRHSGAMTPFPGGGRCGRRAS